MNNTLVSLSDINGAAKVLRAIKHPLRLKMLSLIDEEEKICVTDIYGKLNIDQTVASLHLGIMRNEGIIATEREGRFYYYFVNRERLEQINRVAKELASATIVPSAGEL